jgi:hypothetical protein
MHTLRVRGKPGVLVPHPFAFGTNPPRFVGKEPIPNASPNASMIERMREADAEIADDPFIRDAVRAGHLLPLDEDTAKRCGVEFLPSST